MGWLALWQPIQGIRSDSIVMSRDRFQCRSTATGTHTQARQLLSFSQVNPRAHDGCMNPPPQDTSSAPRLLRRGRIQSHPRGTTYSAGSWQVRRWRSTRGRNAVPPPRAPRIFRGFPINIPWIFVDFCRCSLIFMDVHRFLLILSWRHAPMLLQFSSHLSKELSLIHI